MNYVVAIPSFNRPEIIVSKTLRTLYEGGIPNNIIYVFVADEDEKIRYEKTLPSDITIVVGRKGISYQRNFIVDYFPENKAIVSIDDDVDGIYKRKSDKELEKIICLKTFFKRAFEDLINEGLYIWGIYPVCNPFFMKNKTTTDFKFIVGTLYGFINRKIDEVLPSIATTEKEDYILSIMYYMKDGGMVRYNDIAVKHKKHSIGGLGKYSNRVEANDIASQYILKTYSNYATSFKRKNGFSEIRLKQLKRKHLYNIFV